MTIRSGGKNQRAINANKLLNTVRYECDSDSGCEFYKLLLYLSVWIVNGVLQLFVWLSSLQTNTNNSKLQRRKNEKPENTKISTKWPIGISVHFSWTKWSGARAPAIEFNWSAAPVRCFSQIFFILFFFPKFKANEQNSVSLMRSNAYESEIKCQNEINRKLISFGRVEWLMFTTI